MAEDPPTLADRVRQVLHDRGWSQQQLADVSGLDRSVLSRLMSGRRQWSRDRHVDFVAEALGQTADELLSGTVEEARFAENQSMRAEHQRSLASLVEQLHREQSRNEALRAQNERLRDTLGSSADPAELQRLQEELDSARSARDAALNREEKLRQQMQRKKNEVEQWRAEAEGLRHELRSLTQKHQRALEAAENNAAAARQWEQQAQARGWAGASIGAAAVGLIALAASGEG